MFVKIILRNSKDLIKVKKTFEILNYLIRILKTSYYFSEIPRRFWCYFFDFTCGFMFVSRISL